MPIRKIDNTDVQYYLVSFDEHGNERPENGTLLSEAVRKRLADPAEAITDVFLASHGWKGDVPAAIAQYDRWMGEMARSPDRVRIKQQRPDFKALNVGLHWPSLPFGDEDLPAEEGATLSASNEPDLEAQVAQFASTIADTPTARQAIRTILLGAKLDDGSSDELAPAVRDAYRQLIVEAHLDQGSEDLGAAPGTDHPAFDAESMYRDARSAEIEAEGGATLGGGFLSKLKGFVVAPLQQLSFWKMKDRARAIGESGAHTLLASLMQAAPKTRFHLMGHSFGCIVVSATVAGDPNGAPLPRPVDTLFLVQGALSLWSFSPDIPFAPGTSGYFNRIVKKGLVRGPIVTTRSPFDTAVGKLYPAAAKVKDQVVLNDDLPKFGGVGTFGAQGLGTFARDGELLPEDKPYSFEPGRIYNLDASGVIKTGGGFSGAHSDIAHPETAHAFWQAVAVAP